MIDVLLFASSRVMQKQKIANIVINKPDKRILNEIYQFASMRILICYHHLPCHNLFRARHLGCCSTSLSAFISTWFSLQRRRSKPNDDTFCPPSSFSTIHHPLSTHQFPSLPILYIFYKSSRHSFISTLSVCCSQNLVTPISRWNKFSGCRVSVLCAICWVKGFNSYYNTYNVTQHHLLYIFMTMNGGCRVPCTVHSRGDESLIPT